MDSEASDYLECMLLDESVQPTDLPLSLLQSITNNFSNDQEIGTDGSAVVYKGLLRNGHVAVKKLFLSLDVHEKTFHDMVNSLMRVKHKNIQRFLGYCSDTKGKMWKLGDKTVMAEERHRLLCFEFLPQGSLDRFISDAAQGLEWMTRYQIIKGICEGLHYLHQQKIVHLDLKPANILLDQYMVPKIADFGLSKCFDENQTRVMTSNLLGSQGYMAPELYGGPITFKSDIYSLGIVIIEILTGHKGYHEIENVLEIWSTRFQTSLGDAWLDTVRVWFEIGIECTDFNPTKRPDTQRIIERLAEMEHKYGFLETGRFTSSGTNEKKRSTELRPGPPKMLGETIIEVARSQKLCAPVETTNSSYNMRYEELNCLECILDGRDEPKNLKLPLLELITENFSSGNKVGRGGCGEVYKGILPNGRFVAVKRLFKSHTIDEKMFNQEVKSMLVAKHRNIVRFLGYCSDTQGKAVSIEGDHHMAEERERLLCFEYIQNGKLADHITDELRGLDWCARYQIIKGICEGLHHLHKDKGILHMDLKPDNILMDDYMVPKITDFGLARTDGKTHTMSTQRLASPGYCAPEYLHQGKMSNKSDIYSLGIIIGQVVTGSKEEPDITKVLGRWRHRWSKSSKHVPLWHEQVKKCLELALQCTRKNPIRRPFIWEILEELNEIDNKNGKARGDTESANEELSPCLEHMLGVEPLEIHFPLALDKEISCSVELTNDTDDYIAFMVSTTSLLQFRTQPKKDIIPPRSKCSVIIAVQAQENAPLNYQSDFYVHSTTVDGTLTTKDITDELFDEEEGHVVDEVNLPVVFNALPPLP